MKICPKCGTALTDDKKKCYMCGADLENNTTSFGDSFNDQIGNSSSSSKNENPYNIFSTPPKQDEPSLPNIDEDSFKSGADFFPPKDNYEENKGSLSGLNSMQHDSRNAFEKMFSNKEFKSKDDINALENKKKMFGNKPKKPTPPPKPKKEKNKPHPDQSNNNPIPPLQNNNGFEIPPLTPSKEADSYTGITLSKEKLESKKNKFFLKDNKDVSSEVAPPKNLMNKNKSKKVDWQQIADKDAKTQKKYKKPDTSFIINTIIFIAFLIAVLFVYLLIIKPRKDKVTPALGGLNYTISEQFTLQDDDKNSRYYTYGDNCALRLTYGEATGQNSFVSNYFSSIRDKYAAEEKFLTLESKMTIGGISWSSLSVIEPIEGMPTPIMVYEYLSVIYHEKYYQIEYTNLDNDSTCTQIYNETISSINF